MITDNSILESAIEVLDRQIYDLELSLPEFKESGGKKKPLKQLNDSVSISLDDPQIQSLCGFDRKPTYENGMSLIESAQGSDAPDLYCKAGYRLFLRGALDTGDKALYLGIAHCLKNGIGTEKNVKLAKVFDKKGKKSFSDRLKGFGNLVSDIFGSLGEAIYNHPRISITVVMTALLAIFLYIATAKEFLNPMPLIQLTITLVCATVFLGSLIFTSIVYKEIWRYLISLAGVCLFGSLALTGGFIDNYPLFLICSIGIEITFILVVSVLSSGSHTRRRILLDPSFLCASVFLITIGLLPLLFSLPDSYRSTYSGIDGAYHVIPALAIYAGVGFTVANLVSYYSHKYTKCIVGAPLGIATTALAFISYSLMERVPSTAIIILQFIMIACGATSLLLVWKNDN